MSISNDTDDVKFCCANIILIGLHFKTTPTVYIHKILLKPPVKQRIKTSTMPPASYMYQLLQPLYGHSTVNASKIKLFNLHCKSVLHTVASCFRLVAFFELNALKRIVVLGCKLTHIQAQYITIIVNMFKLHNSASVVPPSSV